MDQTHSTQEKRKGKDDNQSEDLSSNKKIRLDEQTLNKKIYANGNIYIGKIKNELPHGIGKMIYHNDIKYIFYEGHWENGKPHGIGKMLHVNDNKYEGEWVNGLEHGMGKMYYA